MYCSKSVNTCCLLCFVLITKLIGKFPCHVNLIPVNPIKERDYVQPDRSECEAFRNKLEKNGINVTIRREMGADIQGACGQLRKSFLEKDYYLPAAIGICDTVKKYIM